MTAVGATRREKEEFDDSPVLTPAGTVAPGESGHLSAEGPKSWLEYRHPEWKNNRDGWLFSYAHYTGDLLHPNKLPYFLIKRHIGEADEAYEERAKLADYTPHFGAVVDSLAGLLFQVEDRAKRKFGREGTTDGLGEQDDPETIIGRLWPDVDGAGTNYLTFWKTLAIDLIIYHLTWVMVDTDATGKFAQLKCWPAMNVVNWRYEGQRLVEVLVEESADTRGSIKEDPKPARRYILFEPGRWTRFRQEKEQAVLVDTGEHSFVDSTGNQVLPIFPVRLPIKRNVGWVLARKANAIFNKESERDHILRNANFPLLNLMANDNQFDALVQKLKAGYRVLQNDPAMRGKAHHFIAPSAESAKVATEVLQRKVDEFWITAFREYSDAAQERVTATEIRQDVAAGVGAFLQMLKAGVDEAENQALFRIAQIELPNSKGQWFVNTVERSDDFVPLDIQSEIDRLKNRYFGETSTVPTGRTGKVAAARKIAEWDGVTVDDDELEAAVGLHIIRDNLEPFRELPVPPEVKAELTIQMMIALDVIDAEKEVELDDGKKAKLVDLVRERAIEMAEQQQEMQKNLALPPGPSGGESPPPKPNQKEKKQDG